MIIGEAESKNPSIQKSTFRSATTCPENFRGSRLRPERTIRPQPCRDCKNFAPTETQSRELCASIKNQKRMLQPFENPLRPLLQPRPQKVPVFTDLVAMLRPFKGINTVRPRRRSPLPFPSFRFKVRCSIFGIVFRRLSAPIGGYSNLFGASPITSCQSPITKIILSYFAPLHANAAKFYLQPRRRERVARAAEVTDGSVASFTYVNSFPRSPENFTLHYPSVGIVCRNPNIQRPQQQALAQRNSNNHPPGMLTAPKLSVSPKDLLSILK